MNSAKWHRNEYNICVCSQYSLPQRCPFYLISFIPADILHFGEFLGSLHHKVNEVSTSTQTADDEKVGQDPEKSCQMDIFFFVTLLFIHYWFLDVWKWDVNNYRPGTNRNYCCWCCCKMTTYYIFINKIIQRRWCRAPLPYRELFSLRWYILLLLLFWYVIPKAYIYWLLTVCQI